jgi:hypothetical protein
MEFFMACRINLIIFAGKNMERLISFLRNTKVSKGGLIGGMVGGIASVKSHQPADTTIKKAGKTALFAGIGYFIGEWIEGKLKK